MLLQAVHRGKVVRTTVAESKAPCLQDKVNRQSRAERPNQLWVSDSTYVSTWQGWLYVAFVVDVFSRRIEGWRVSTSMTTDFVLDAQEQVLYARQPERDGTLTRPPAARRGHAWSDHRRVLSGIVWLLHTGAPWRERSRSLRALAA